VEVPRGGFTAQVGGRILAANGVAAAFVWAYLVFVAPSDVPRAEADVAVSLAFFLGFVAVAGAAYLGIGEREWRRSLGWLATAAAPTAAQRRATLAEPRRHAGAVLAGWAGAAVFFGLGTTVFGGTSAARGTTVALATVMGGMASAAVTFLLIEHALRPAWAAVLPAGEGEVHGRVAVPLRTRLLLVWALGSGVPLVALAVLPLSVPGAVERADIGPAVTALALAGLASGLAVARAGARSVVDPMDAVRALIGRVAAGDLGSTVPVTDPAEVGLLQAGVNDMIRGLRERERLRDRFGRHVGHDVVRRELAGQGGLGGEVTAVTALFVDLRGSTALAERLPPTEVVDLLNRFFRTVVRVVADAGGRIDKFEGDGALCVFDDPAAALAAARALLVALDEPELRDRGLAAGIGLSSGLVVAGNVGSDDRYEYTIIGRPVNEAARLADHAKQGAPAALAAATTVDAAGDDERAAWQQAGTREIRGQSTPVAVWVPARAT
jgi:adenylate cyclase